MAIYHKGKLISGLRGPAGPDGNPIGTIISYIGLTAPKGYLVCDGAEYHIPQYLELARFFETQFGTVNHFGGDGTTTFAVPKIADETGNSINCIKAVTSISSENVYSIEEQVVGCWIDGKPIYRKYFEGVTGAVAVEKTIGSVPGIETLVNHYAYLYRDDVNTIIPVPTSVVQYWAIYLSIVSENISVYVTQDFLTNKRVAGWIEYTKTTDPATSKQETVLTSQVELPQTLSVDSSNATLDSPAMVTFPSTVAVASASASSVNLNL